jgi:hypothetical protein
MKFANQSIRAFWSVGSNSLSRHGCVPHRSALFPWTENWRHPSYQMYKKTHIPEVNFNWNRPWGLICKSLEEEKTKILLPGMIPSKYQLTPWRQNPKVNHRVHRSLQPVPILSQLNPLRPLKPISPRSILIPSSVFWVVSFLRAFPPKQLPSQMLLAHNSYEFWEITDNIFNHSQLS